MKVEIVEILIMGALAARSVEGGSGE